MVVHGSSTPLTWVRISLPAPKFNIIIIIIMRTDIQNGYKVNDERIEDLIVDELSRLDHKLDTIINIMVEKLINKND